MYGLPKDINLSFFQGKELVQLCLGRLEVIMHFDDDISISVEDGGFTFDNLRYKKQEESKKGYILYVLIGKKILAALQGTNPGDLVLDFEEGHRLILHDDSEQYQSYHFWSPEGLVVV